MAGPATVQFLRDQHRGDEEAVEQQLGFGGDLRHGEATGLAGADKICTEIAETSMPGAGAKGWRAFLSAVGPPVVNAIDRLGNGPWYDRMGRLVAMDKARLSMQRPMGADPAIINDLPNENGIPNHLDGAPGCTGGACPDNHDVLTGSNNLGNLDLGAGATCDDWTSSTGVTGMRPRVGHSWPANSGMDWRSALYEGGCAPGINLVQMGPPVPGVFTVGTGGGYGAIYCFANAP